MLDWVVVWVDTGFGINCLHCRLQKMVSCVIVYLVKILLHCVCQNGFLYNCIWVQLHLSVVTTPDLCPPFLPSCPHVTGVRSIMGPWLCLCCCNLPIWSLSLNSLALPQALSSFRASPGPQPSQGPIHSHCLQSPSDEPPGNALCFQTTD